MNEILILTFLFFIGSILGWFFELLYRRVISSKRWINPGFLTGPYLPIYGFGLCVLYLMSSIDLNFIGNEVLEKIILIIFMAMAMTLIEYIAGLIFIKGMKIKLWDYSQRWGNIDGIICPLFLVIWGIIGGIYFIFVHPYILDALSWLQNNLAFSFVIGYFFGVVSIDVVHSLNMTVKIRKFAKDNNILVRFEELKEQIRIFQEEKKEKISYLLPFRNSGSLKKMLELYKEKMKNIENKYKITWFVKPKE